MTKTQCKLVLRISDNALTNREDQIGIDKFINEMMTWLRWGQDYGTRYTYGAEVLRENIKLERRRYTVVFPQLTVEDANAIIEQLRQMKKSKKDYAALRECWLEEVGDQE